MRKFCHGSPACIECGASHAEGEIQNCPSPFRSTADPAPTTGQHREQRLGDWTEQLFASLGITKDRYIAAKEAVGLAPTCDCVERKAWLNKVSDWWRGESARTE